MTGEQTQRNWRFLDDIFYELGHLDHPLYSVFASQEHRQEARKSVLTRALRSGNLPIRGCRDTSFGPETSEHIEAKIDAETEINIVSNEITLCKVYDIPATDNCPARKDRLEIAKFKRVQADKASVEQWLRKNVLPAGDEAPDDVETGEKAEESSSPNHKKRPQPKRDRAKRLLQKIFGDRLPSKADLPDHELLRKCKGPEWNDISTETILRAATDLREAQQSAEPQAGAS